MESSTCPHEERSPWGCLAVRLAGVALPSAQGQQWPHSSRMKHGHGVPSRWEGALLHSGVEDETGRSPRGPGYSKVWYRYPLL